MGEVVTPLSGYRYVAIDTAILIYYLEDDPVFSTAAEAILKDIEDGKLSASISVIALTEVLTGAYRAGEPTGAAGLAARIHAFPNLTILDVDHGSAQVAARVRGQYGFRLPDAVHLASALESGAEAFITNDHRLRQFPELPVLLLSDFIH